MHSKPFCITFVSTKKKKNNLNTKTMNTQPTTTQIYPKSIVILGMRLVAIGIGKFPYECRNKDKSPNAMIYQGESCWCSSESYDFRNRSADLDEYESVTNEPSFDELKAQYLSMPLDDLRLIKKEKYPNVDITTAMSNDEKAINEAIATKFSELNQKIKEKRQSEKSAANQPQPTKTMEELINVVEYLKYKKVPFFVKMDYEKNTVSIGGVDISKEGKFFKANGIVISGNMARYFIK